MKIFEDGGRRYEVPDDVYDQLIGLQRQRDYLDKRQYNLKISMNSMYGALSNPHFRFFDPRMGNSTTATGRAVLGHITRVVGQYFDGEYKYPSPSAIYGDTDSSYFTTGATTREEAIRRADDFGKTVTASMPEFMERQFLCRGKNANLIKVAREVVADKALYVNKKMYMMRVVDKKGKLVDEMKIMGLMLKKTTIPKKIANRASEAFERFIKSEDWKEFQDAILDLKQSLIDTSKTDPTVLGLPKSIKSGLEIGTRNLEIDPKTRVSGHVMAAINYNRCLKLFNDTSSMALSSGTKCRLYYLKSKTFGCKTIALPTDQDIIPAWFTEHFVPMIDVAGQISRLVDSPVKQVTVALGKRAPTFHDRVVEDSLEF